MKWRGISTDAATVENSSRPLRDRLLEVRAGIAQYVRPENQQINERTIEWIRAAGLSDKALGPGAYVPSFELVDQSGRDLSSAKLLTDAPLIIVFFRGRWCPFCVAQLESWRDALPRLKQAGPQLVTISPQNVHQNSLTADQHRLPFPLLSDPGHKVAQGFGVAYRVPEEQELLYRRSFVNLSHVNGDDSWQLPLASTFVVSQDGKIAAAFVSADYRERTEPLDVLRLF